MNIYIFAIGGTGARVLRSLTYCLSSGMHCIPQGTKFIPLIIDYDKENGDKTRAIHCMEKYKSIRDDAYNGITINNNDHCFFQPEIAYLSSVAPAAGVANNQIPLNSFEFDFGLAAGHNNRVFSDEIGYTQLGGNMSLTRDLLESLFNDSPTFQQDLNGQTLLDANNQPIPNPFAELNIEMSEGFRGNPNIGSIVFQQLRETKEFIYFTNTFNPQSDRVFVISSIFGGTGSSGFPRIIDAIRYSGIQGYDTVPIGASIVMPYFKVNNPGDGAINSNVFVSKQKAALSYYNTPDAQGKSLFDKLSISYFVADDNPTTIPYAEGRGNQKNDAHIVELLAALSIVDFASRPDAAIRNAILQPLNTRVYEFGLSHPPAPNTNIVIDSFDGENDNANSNTQQRYIDFITCQALAFKYYKDYVETGDIPQNTSYYNDNALSLASKIGTGMYANLHDFIDDFEKWIDEMACQDDSFRPYRHNPRVEDNSPVAQDLDDFLVGYMSSASGIFRRTPDSSFESFSSYCNHEYHDISREGSVMNNLDYVFLQVLYNAASNCLNYYSPEN